MTRKEEESSNDYLWNREGDAGEVKDLEAVFAPLRHQAPLQVSWRRPWLTALIMATCAAVLFFAVIAPGRAPARFVGVFHDGPVSELSIHGGTRVELSVNDGKADRALSRRIAVAMVDRGAGFVFAGTGQVVLELPEYDTPAATAWAKRIASQGRMTMHRVVENSQYMHEAVEFIEGRSDLTAEGGDDQWISDVDGRMYFDDYVIAPDRQSLDAAFEAFKSSGIAVPAGFEIVYEELDDGRWRSYYIDSAREMSSDDIAASRVIWDPTSGRPEVFIDYTKVGGDRFASLTASSIGKKIAIVLDGEVNSAPTVQSAITGGSSVISMGSDEPQTMSAEAEALAAVLTAPVLPADVEVASVEAVAPSVSSGAMVAAEALTAFLFGLCLFALAWPLEKSSRSRVPLVAILRGGQRRMGATVRPMLVSLGVVAAVLGLSRMWLPGTEDVMTNLLTGDESDASVFSLAQLGIMPFLVGAVLAEAIAWVIPAWRKRRGAGAGSRAPIDRLALVLGLALLAGQAYFMSAWLADLTQADSLLPGLLGAPINQRFTLLALVGGSSILYGLSRIVDRFGIGNGYAVVLMAGVLPALPAFVENMRGLSSFSPFGFFQCFLLLAGSILATNVLMRRTVQFGNGNNLNLPGAGIAPLLILPVVLGNLSLLSLAFGDGVYTVLVPGEPMYEIVQLALVLGFSLVLALFALRRPQACGDARVVGGAETSPRLWSLAGSLAVSVAFPLAVFWVMRTLGEWDIGVFVLVTSFILGTGVIVDLLGEVRARFRNPELMQVWQLQRPRYLLPVLAALDSAGIDVFVRGRYFRVLLSVLGPFAPMSIMVPEHRSAEAREIIAGQV